MPIFCYISFSSFSVGYEPISFIIFKPFTYSSIADSKLPSNRWQSARPSCARYDSAFNYDKFLKSDRAFRRLFIWRCILPL